MVIFFLFLMISQSAWVFSGDSSRTYPGYFPRNLAECLKYGECIESTDSEVDLGDGLYMQKIVSEQGTDDNSSWFRVGRIPEFVSLRAKNHEIYQIVNKKNGKKLIFSKSVRKRKGKDVLLVTVLEIPLWQYYQPNQFHSECADYLANYSSEPKGIVNANTSTIYTLEKAWREIKDAAKLYHALELIAENEQVKYVTNNCSRLEQQRFFSDDEKQNRNIFRKNTFVKFFNAKQEELEALDKID